MRWDETIDIMQFFTSILGMALEGLFWLHPGRFKMMVQVPEYLDSCRQYMVVCVLILFVRLCSRIVGSDFRPRVKSRLMLFFYGTFLLISSQWTDCSLHDILSKDFFIRLPLAGLSDVTLFMWNMEYELP